MKYVTKTIPFALVCAFLLVLSACDSTSVDEERGTAQVMGSIAPRTVAGKIADECPTVVITINDSPASVTFLDDDDCTFLISEVPAAEAVSISVELVDEGITGIIVLEDVVEDELIEIFIEPGIGSLVLSIVRRVTPEPEEGLPERITDNNVEISLGAGEYDQDLTVDGNKVTITGLAGEDCASDGWTVITGDVTVNGNKALFRNIKFLSDVTVRGNKASFINTCFGESLVSFGSKADRRIDHDDDDDDDDD